MHEENKRNRRSLINMINSLGLGLVALLTAFVFFFGHLAGYFYYSSWGVDYLSNADTITPYIFTMSSFGVFLSTIIIFFSLVFIVPISAFIFKDLPLSDGSRFYHSFYNRFINAFSLLRYLLILLILFYFIGLLLFYVSASDAKIDVNRKLYHPINVQVTDGKTYQCLHSLGQLGIYRVFITSEMQPVYIQSSQIKLMFHPMTLPPQEQVKGHKLEVRNSFFEQEYQLWLKNWNELCSANHFDKPFFNHEFIRSKRDELKK